MVRSVHALAAIAQEAKRGQQKPTSACKEGRGHCAMRAQYEMNFYVQLQQSRHDTTWVVRALRHADWRAEVALHCTRIWVIEIACSGQPQGTSGLAHLEVAQAVRIAHAQQDFRY